jgi:hypothetical protein
MISRHDVVAVQDVKDAATYLLKDKPDWKCTSCVAVSVSVPSAVVVSERKQPGDEPGCLGTASCTLGIAQPPVQLFGGRQLTKLSLR